MNPIVGLVLAYLLGSIPFAYLAGHLARGIDLRAHGSGNLGATNVYRVLGGRIALAVLLLDAAKGALPVIFFPRWIETTAPQEWAIGFGIAAIVGHVRPIFLLWKGGGKGVATASGVFFGLVPLPMVLTLVVFVAVVFVSGYVSLASLTAAAMLPLVLLFTLGVQSPLFILSLVVAAFVFWTHRANIGRLRRGEELRFGKKAGGGGGVR